MGSSFIFVVKPIGTSYNIIKVGLGKNSGL